MADNINRIKRHEIDDDWAHSAIVEAGGFAFISYCMGNVGEPIDGQINGAIDTLEQRLQSIGLTLESVVKMDCLFKTIDDLPAIKQVFHDRFHSVYPSRKAVQSDFVVEGLLFQLDAIAFRG